MKTTKTTKHVKKKQKYTKRSAYWNKKQEVFSTNMGRTIREIKPEQPNPELDRAKTKIGKLKSIIYNIIESL